MIREAMQFVSTLAQEASGRRVFRPDGEPPNVYLVMKPDGTYERVQTAEPPDRSEALDIDTLCRVAVAYLVPEKPSLPGVWYSRDGVVADLTPPAEHGPTCTLKLSMSPQLARLAEWDRQGRVSLEQAPLIITLRTLFAGCVPDSLVKAVRNVRATKNTDGRSEVGHGKVSVGKSIVAELTGADAIPEQVTFQVPVFAQSSVKVTQDVRVAIDPDVQNERFTLVVLPGDIEQAQTNAEAILAKRIGDCLAGLAADDRPADAIPVYRGRP